MIGEEEALLNLGKEIVPAVKLMPNTLRYLSENEMVYLRMFVDFGSAKEGKEAYRIDVAFAEVPPEEVGFDAIVEIDEDPDISNEQALWTSKVTTKTYRKVEA